MFGTSWAFDERAAQPPEPFNHGTFWADTEPGTREDNGCGIVGTSFERNGSFGPLRSSSSAGSPAH